MLSLIAQLTGPGYNADDPVSKVGGPPVFDVFSKLFSPGTPDTSLGMLVTQITPFAIVSAGLVFFAKLLLAGSAYMTSAGDQDKIEKATKDLTNSAIGLVVTISAFFLLQIIQVVFGLRVI